MGLDPIWTLAPNKLVAKAASRVIKPSGELIVAGGEEQAFMAPLPLPLVPGLDGLDLQRFRELNLATAGQAARLSLVQLEVPFGRRADFLHEVLRGVDLSPVRPPGARPPAETAAHLFDEDTNRPALLEAALFGLVERLGRRLRRQRLALRRLVVCLAYSDGLQCARAIGVRPATANDLLLFPRARAALQHAWQRRVRVRRLELRCEELVFPPAQRELFDADRRAAERRAGLVAAVDAVRERFGPQALRFGRSLAAA
jgi:DNA polymerase-4